MTDPQVDLDQTPVTGLNVWVIGINYAPDKVGIAPYTTQMSEYLAERGANVAVTTGIPYYPAYEVDPEYKRVVSRTETVNGVAVRRLRHTVPRQMTALRRVLHELSFLVHASVRTPPFEPDVIVAVTPALSGAVAATRWAKKLSCPLVVVFQDLVGPGVLQSGIAGGGKFSLLAARLEKRVVKAAADVVVLHLGFAGYIRGYIRRYGQAAERLHIIRNWSYALPAETPREKVRAELGWGDETVVLYGGNIGLKMDMENVIEAGRLVEQRGIPVRFVLLGDGNQRAMLEDLARGVSTVQFVDPRYGSGFPDALAAADILLINERPSMDNMSLPSKLTYYFHSGNPVLAAVADAGTTAQEIELADAGVVIEPGDPELLIETVTAMASDPDEMARMGANGKAFATKQYDKSAILEHYERVILGAVGGPRAQA